MRLARRQVVALLASVALPRPGLAAGLPANAMAVLTEAARALFPHRAVADAVYGRIVARLVTTASPDQRAALAAAAAALAGPADTRPARLSAAIALPGVQALRVATLIGLYGDLAVVRGFGYPGPSLDFGGYLDHGVGDLDWLPEPGPAWLP